jgi:hypothetical protein
MRTRVAVAVMAALLILYLVFAAGYAIMLIGIGEPVAIAIGVGLLILPLVGAWALVSEIVFAVRAERLAKRLEAEGGIPSEPVPVSASGRIDRTAADALFPSYKAAVDAAPDSWRAWFRLALAYDASGDRRRARWATRTAIRLARPLER